jgi:tetratricopeptide (TPR) repeat protein
MPNFVWTAKDKFGKSAIREITADTAEQAKAQLLTEGCIELELKENEIHDAAVAGFTDKTVVLGEEVKATTEQRLKQRGNPPMTFSRALRKSVFQGKKLSILIILLAFYEGYRGNKTSVILLGIALLLWIMFTFCVKLPSIYFAKLNEAKDWNRWEEVLELVETLKKIRRNHFIKMPIVELIRSRAQALAGMGRMSEGLEEFRQCENQPGCPGWLYTAFVAELYQIGKQYDKAIEYKQKAVEQKPIPANWIDLTNYFLRFKKDTGKAREALAQAEKGILTETEKPYLTRCHGILAYLEKNYAVARQELETGLHIVEQRHQPFKNGYVNVAKGYLCCVLAKQGDLAAAKKYFTEAKEYLIATEETDLIQECKQALGASNL